MAGIWAVATDVLAFLQVYNGAVTALATIAIGLFTLSLVRVSNRQARLTRDSIDLARKEFIATHRPKLRVRRFQSHLNEGEPVKISYIVANIGDSPGEIKGIGMTIGIRKADGTELQDRPEIGESRRIKPGENCLYLAVASSLVYEAVWGLMDYTQAWVSIRGTIEYTDDNGVERSTGFWRTRGARTGDFTPYRDTDYEYED